MELISAYHRGRCESEVSSSMEKRLFLKGCIWGWVCVMIKTADDSWVRRWHWRRCNRYGAGGSSTTAMVETGVAEVMEISRDINIGIYGNRSDK